MSTPEQPQASRLRVGRWLPAQRGRRPVRAAEALTVPLPRIVDPAAGPSGPSGASGTTAQLPQLPQPSGTTGGRRARRRRTALALGVTAVAAVLAAGTLVALHGPTRGPAATTPASVGDPTGGPDPLITTGAPSASASPGPHPSPVRSASPTAATSASATTLDVTGPPVPPPQPVSYEAEAPGNTRLGQVHPRPVAEASGGLVIGWIGNGPANVLRFNAVSAVAAGAHRVTVYYVAGEARTALITVNNATPVTVSFPSTGGWSTVGSLTVTLTLAAGANTVAVSNPTAWAPDIDRLVAS